MTDEVRTALAVIVKRGMSDELVARAAAVLGAELKRLDAIEARVIELLDSADADIAQHLYYGHQLEWDENCAEDGEYWIYPGGKPTSRMADHQGEE